ncbi:group II intron reverse transcriptase/maturase [Endozoicomonas euniceicola]|uniref:Group II intron reverse transcriptase/maturase n=2 Tax=Endozoicomonas euniceicola TaxID=1234143 RepID=A0ABY6H1U8_9GAMM|nr:group II intron reverse transcriptase/maturase [Endozoicomonas euniceicola]UYM18885.1 group II intron reverse transcriptase/maturase [Endozoicomonas euniceicola]
MQCKLATWATKDKCRRFDRLLRLIAEPLWLKEAARITLASSGAHTPGVDGMTKMTVESRLPQLLLAIREQLLDGTYQPLPARRVYIPKGNGKMRPLGIPTLRDRIVQRAMLMAMEPIWESDFHRLSYGFRPERSVHHAIRTVKLQLEDNTHTSGRWVIEGDLSSYFDTVHHRLLMKGVRRRIRDQRFLNLLWRFIKSGHIDKKLFCAASEGVPQGGVASPLLANIMLHEFDQYLEERYLSPKARKDRWYWNHTVKIERPVAIKENRQWQPAVTYCRYADDFVVIVKGTKTQAEAIRDECRELLENKLKLTLNMEKTHVTHVNEGFVFLGHRIIRKRNRKGEMRVSTSIPKDKVRNFIAKLTKELSGNYSMSKIDMVDKINRKLKGWSNFYQFTDNTAMVYNKVDRVVFWKLGHWLARKYRCCMKPIMKKWCKYPEVGKAKTWVLFGKTDTGNLCGKSLFRLVSSPKKPFRFRLPECNPYLRNDDRKTVTSRYDDVAMAFSHC